MTNKEMILDSLINDDEAFTQIVEYFELFAEVKVAPSEIKELLAEMVEEGYITMNYSWKNEHDEYPYSLTEKGATTNLSYNNIKTESLQGISEHSISIWAQRFLL